MGTTLIKTNREYLLDEAIALGFTGDHKADSKVLLLYIAQSKAGLQPNKGTNDTGSLPNKVAINIGKIDKLYDRGTFRGEFTSFPLLEAGMTGVHLNEGDYAIYGDNKVSGANTQYKTTLTLYNGSKWVVTNSPVVIMSTSNAPVIDGPRGLLVFEEDTGELRIKSSSTTYILNKVTTVVDGYALSIV